MNQRLSAFSLVEVLAAIAIIGIVTFLAVPNIIRLKQDGEENLARARAEALNMAMASYVQAVGPSAAQTTWSGADNDGRYDLIASYLAFAEPTIDNFMPGGYSATLPASVYPLTTKTTVTGPSGEVAY
ncbi:MAG: type II secretion system protein [Terrimicrobiaceae bacterium]|nr:type II secretion system protein [Terrimicrobiaceae bacterium]